MEVIPGRVTVEIPNIPMTAEPDSVRASARGTVQSQLLGVELRRTFYAETPIQKVRDLEERLQSLRDEDQLLANQENSVQKELDHLDGIIGATHTFAYALSSGKSSLDAHKETLDFYRERRGAGLEAFQEIHGKRRTLAKQIEKTQRELDSIQSERDQEKYTAHIELEVVDSGKLEVDLIYHTSHCGWKPAYDFRKTDDRLELTYLGQVQQATGEPWEEIQLTLSTAYPSLSAILPELKPWFIAPHRPPAKAAAPSQPQPEMRGGPPKVSAMPETPSPALQAASVTTADIQQSGASITYKVSGDLTIPEDGSPRKTTIAVIELSHETDYLATPKLAEAIYRRVKATNDSPYLLLPGQAQLFAHEDYLGTTRVDLTSPGGEIELYYGVDDRLKVERELTQRDTDKRLIGDRRRIRIGYEIKVMNHLDRDARLTVRDQLPVGRHEDINVKLESCDPSPAKHDDLNRLEWSLMLGPSEEKKIRFAFLVEHPRELNLIGL
jgi:uncharacterized protein (TIGR02231 family)